MAFFGLTLTKNIISKCIINLVCYMYKSRVKIIVFVHSFVYQCVIIRYHINIIFLRLFNTPNTIN